MNIRNAFSMLNSVGLEKLNFLLLINSIKNLGKPETWSLNRLTSRNLFWSISIFLMITLRITLPLEYYSLLLQTFHVTWFKYLKGQRTGIFVKLLKQILWHDFCFLCNKCLLSFICETVLVQRFAFILTW